jgi:hypothetical protein
MYESCVQQPLNFAFVAATFASDILRSLCLLGFVEGLTCSLCSIMSLFTPIKSEIHHAKTSLFLSRNESNSISLFDVKSWEIIIVLSSTIGSNGTLLVSHSGSIGLLAGLPSLSLLVAVLQLSAFLSCKQFTFLWP